MESRVMTYEPDDYIKAEIVDEASKESEWLWVRVDRCDDQERLIFGTLDNIPVVNTDLRLGQQIAVSYSNVRDHRKSSDF
jgi:uncharacterized protein YegJ (DUF2314 family)